MKGQVLVVGALVLVVAGCTAMPEFEARVQELFPESPLALVERMSTLEGADERDELATEVAEKYKQDPSARNGLCLALIRSLPGNALSDDRLALDLLETIDRGQLRASDRRVAAWLGQELQVRRSLRSRNEALAHDLASTRAALSRAREKIEILTRIEETVGPQLEQRK